MFHQYRYYLRTHIRCTLLRFFFNRNQLLNNVICTILRYLLRRYVCIYGIKTIPLTKKLYRCHLSTERSCFLKIPYGTILYYNITYYLRSCLPHQEISDWNYWYQCNISELCFIPVIGYNTVYNNILRYKYFAQSFVSHYLIQCHLSWPKPLQRIWSDMWGQSMLSSIVSRYMQLWFFSFARIHFIYSYFLYAFFVRLITHWFKIIAFDKRTRSARELLRQISGDRFMKANPKLKVTSHIMTTIDPPLVQIKFVDGNEVRPFSNPNFCQLKITSNCVIKFFILHERCFFFFFKFSDIFW